MVKASPMSRAFNAGEFSELLDGRTDLDRYPASLHVFENFVAAPQGPAISRSGTTIVATAADESKKSVLVPFVFSNEQAKQLEFATDRIRFLDEDGIQVYTAVAATNGSAALGTLTLTSPTLAASVGEQVVLGGFPPNYNMNGEIVKILTKVGTTYTFSFVHPSLPTVACTVARVYSVPCVYTETELEGLRYLQSVDVLYLMSSRGTRKLSRFGTYDWRLEDVKFSDGPYIPTNTTPTTLKPGSTGNAVVAMTSNTLPSGVADGSGSRPSVPGTRAVPVDFLGRDISYNLGVSAFYLAFDADDNTYWAANTAQSGILSYQHATPFVCDGYTIFAAKENQDPNYSAKDYAPSAWTFEGFDGSAWVVLDQQQDYVLYDGNKSVFFELDNTTSYSVYRLNISKTVRNGLIEPRVRRLTMRNNTNPNIVLTASSVVGINNDTGFKATDVGRAIRLRGSDGAWRETKIVTFTSTTQVTVKLLGEPFLNAKAISSWRLGAWSDTTGWPVTGDFFEDRLWLVGSVEYPDYFAASVTGAYETFSPTDTFGEVLDDSAITGRLNSRKLSGIRWVSSDSRGLLIGTGSEEYTLSTPDGQALTGRNNGKARAATRRGSANVEPVRIDNQLLYVQRGGRTIREFSFVFESDGYKSPSMSQLASHLGAVPFVEMDYAAEPHSIVWMRDGDGNLAGLTYNREENVVGWHRHNLSGGKVESLSVIPQKDQLQDAAWYMVRRQINGQTRRYIERLTRFWDFDTVLEDAHFVDSALRYVGSPTRDVYGLQHLEGEEVYGLADNLPVGPFTVTGGKVTLAYAASNIILGLGYDSTAVLQRLENGAADGGTAQGKVKRIHNITLNVWRSSGGETGVYNEQAGEYVYEPIEYPGRYDVVEDVTLYTGLVGLVTPAGGYDREGRVAFRRPKSSPLPFNILAVMPQLVTQDR